MTKEESKSPKSKILNPEEIPVLPKQFSESLKRIGEQAKEWQVKEESAVLPAPKNKPPVAQSRQMNWSIVSFIMTALVMGLLIAQSVWLRDSLKVLSNSNKDLQNQVQSLQQEFKAKEAEKPPVAAAGDEDGVEHEFDHVGG